MQNITFNDANDIVVSVNLDKPISFASVGTLSVLFGHCSSGTAIKSRYYVI